MLDGYVYAIGGWEGSSRLDTVERYNPETNSWASVASLKIAVTSPAVAACHGILQSLVYGKKPSKHGFETQ